MQGAIGKHMQDADDSASREEDVEQVEGGEPATPEESEAYERAVLAGLEVIFDEKTNSAVMKMLQSGADDPAQAIAQVTAMVIQVLEEQSQGQLPETIIMDLGDELGGNVYDLGVKKGVFQADEKLKGRAATAVSAMLNELYPMDAEDAEGLLAGMPPEQLAQIQSEQNSFGGGA